MLGAVGRSPSPSWSGTSRRTAPPAVRPALPAAGPRGLAPALRRVGLLPLPLLGLGRDAALHVRHASSSRPSPPSTEATSTPPSARQSSTRAPRPPPSSDAPHCLQPHQAHSLHRELRSLHPRPIPRHTCSRARPISAEPTVSRQHRQARSYAQVHPATNCASHIQGSLRRQPPVARSCTSSLDSADVHQRDRLWLSRRDPRRRHGRARLRRHRRRDRRDQAGQAVEGIVPFFEPELPELLSRHVASGRLRFTSDLREATELADVHFICVGTPQKADSIARRPDATSTRSSSSLAPLPDRPCARRRQVHRPGRHRRPVGRHGWPSSPPVGAQAQLAWNPEFLREGFAVQDTLRPDRLVFGAASRGTDRDPARGLLGGPRSRHARCRHRPADRGAGQGRRQRVPRHQDLLHQRHGRDL